MDPPRAVSEDHLEELLPLAKMMMVENDSVGGGCAPGGGGTGGGRLVSQAVYPPYWVSLLSIS